jgi:hypothetical protein
MRERLNLENPRNEEAIEREKRSEVLLRFLHSAENIEPLHGRKIEDIFSNEEEKRAFLENLQETEFAELLDGVNGILRGKKKDEWGMDGETVALEGVMVGVGYVPPRQEDKAELLTEVLASAKEMSRDGKNLKDIALLVSSSLNAIHPYLDANGRTSRLIYTLLTKDFNDETKAELQGVLGRNGRDKLDIDPGLIQHEINDLIEKEIGTTDTEINTDKITNLFGSKRDFQFSAEISEEDQKLFGELLDKDDRYLFLSVFQYLQQQGDREKYLRKFPERSAVPIELLSKNLTQEGLSQILQTYKELKKKYVGTLIGSIAHPENEEYQIDHEGQKISLKDYFELRMKEKAEEIAEEDRLAKERQEAEERELARIDQKENLIKERFNQGEGEYKTFSAEEINALQQLTQELGQIIEAEKSFEGQEYTDEQKVEILTDSLFDLSQRVNANIAVSREQVNVYVAEKRGELLEYFSQYHAAAKLMSHLDNSQIFNHKLDTSKDYEIPFARQEHLEGQKDISRFLDDLFSQSVYYVGENGSSLRLKLFEVKSKKIEEIVQQIMERIFYSEKMVDYSEKKVVRVDSEQPAPRKYIFEIVSPNFSASIQRQTEQAVRADVGIVRDEEGIYVNIPEGSTLHSGWHIVSIKNLRE